MKFIFEFDDYKAYLVSVEEDRSPYQRGFRTRLSETLKCQNAYVSHVLNNDAHFSLEQGIQIAAFLGLAELERKYFLLLIQYARAGSKDLRDYFFSEIKELRKKNLNIKEKVSEAKALGSEAQAIYYSHWMYSAIHMLSTVRGFRTLSALVDGLNLPTEAVKSAVLFLISVGLLQDRKGELYPGHTQLHLGSDSPHIRQHHTNWRVAAIDSLVQMDKGDIHYSTVSSLSFEDAEKLKAKFVHDIQHYVRAVKDSREETLFGFNLDFYSLTKR